MDSEEEISKENKKALSVTISQIEESLDQYLESDMIRFSESHLEDTYEALNQWQDVIEEDNDDFDFDVSLDDDVENNAIKGEISITPPEPLQKVSLNVSKLAESMGVDAIELLQDIEQFYKEEYGEELSGQSVEELKDD
jgi:hypothetical protein